MEKDIKVFLDDVLRIRSSIVMHLNDDKLIKSCVEASFIDAVVFAVSELAGHLAAKAGIPPTEVIKVMADAYELEFKKDETVH